MGNNNMKPHSEYKRPIYTVQDTLTDKEINAMLEDYVEIEVSDLPSIAITTHIRYFTIEHDNKGYAKKVFRIGGNLVKVDKELRYIVLKNGRESWSVQTDHSIFYRQITIDELKDEYEEIIDDYEKEILDLKNTNRKLYEKLKSKNKNKDKKHDKKSDNNERRTSMSATKIVSSVRKSDTKKLKDYMDTSTEKHIRL